MPDLAEILPPHPDGGDLFCLDALIDRGPVPPRPARFVATRDGCGRPRLDTPGRGAHLALGTRQGCGQTPTDPRRNHAQ